ncbi:hypothetical protein HUG17_9147 [Dermatophagoides farinae]|uniref:Uncharacterized protein n=1 Tax=Dermatophagoides farinae TaxID=6954 RepID=A0A9D4NTV9_DERFA|nr:hypothetical protein HUG17_9147 [Dermatophagoides farinae]
MPTIQSNRNVISSFFWQKYTNGSLVEMLLNDFFWMKWFLFRLNISLNDYYHHRIRKTYETFKPTIWIIPISWSFLILTIIMFLWPLNTPSTELKFYEQILRLQSSDLITFQFFIICIMVELVCFFHLEEIIKYRSRFLDFLIIDLAKYEPKINIETRQFMINFYFMEKFITIFIALNLIVIAMCGMPYFYWCIIDYYRNDQIIINEFLYLLIHSLLWSIETLYVAGFFLISGGSFLFCLIYFKKRIQFLYNILLPLQNDKSSYFSQQLYWNYFHNEYTILYDEIYRLNKSLKNLLLVIDILSKTAIIITCVFYSQQIQIKFMNTLIILASISTFAAANILYSFISIIPTYNDKCSRSILQWLARIQYTIRLMQKQQNKFHTY